METQKQKNSERGKKARASGQRFEAKVREDLEGMGWIVDKWTNTVDYDRKGIGKVVPAKRKYNPFKKVMVIGTGFPDFICIKHKKENKTFDAFGDETNSGKDNFDVIGVEVKAKGYLDKIEKGMCFWLIKNKIFSRILVAKKKKIKNRIVVEYKEFEYNKT